MTLRKHLAGAAVAATLLGGGLSAASAQTLTVVKSGTGPYTFAVTVSPSTTVNMLTFDFNGAVTFTSDSGAPFVSPAFSSTGATDSFYAFAGPQTFGSETFTFTPSAGSTATTYNVVASGPSVITPGAGSSGTLTAAPEPGALVSMSVLGACLGLGIVARRRRALAN